MNKEPEQICYTVVWEIHVYAESHEEAAKTAFPMMRDPASIATVLYVDDPQNVRVVIDMEEEANPRIIRDERPSCEV